jgi:hypothetical protein
MSSLADALRHLRLPDERSQQLIEAAAERLDQLELGRANDHASSMHAIEGLRNVFRDEKAAWDAERAKHDAALDEVMCERDEYHDMADRLAQAIADHLLVPIGEHSNCNCPWTRALEEIENAGLCSVFQSAQEQGESDG